MPLLGERRALLERRIRLREFVFGIQDGLLSTVGLLSGVSTATRSAQIVLLTGLAAGVTGGISMAAGSYLAARTEEGIFEKELLDQERLAATEPYLAKEALLEALCRDGLDRPSAYRVVQVFAQHRELLLRTVQEKVLGLGSAALSQPLKAGTVMFSSFLIGALIPVVPFVLQLGAAALPVSWALSVVALLAVGLFKGHITDSGLFRSAVEFAGVALGSAVIGWLIGRLFGLSLP